MKPTPVFFHGESHGLRSLVGWASQVVPGVNDSPANTGDIRDVGSIPGSRRSPGGGYGNPLQ